MVELSNSESKILCQRVFKSLGFPPGMDTELSHALVWLASAEVVPLKTFAQRLNTLEYASNATSSSKCVKPHQFELNIDGDGEYQAIVEFMEMLCTVAVRSKAPIKAEISGISNGMILLPLTLQKALTDVQVDIQMEKTHFCIVDGILRMNQDLEQSRLQPDQTSASVQVSAVSTSSGEMSELSNCYSKQFVQELGLRRIAIDYQSLHVLKAKGAESFVPSSELSRRSGAGAEVDDND